jgi:phosphate transport system protein
MSQHLQREIEELKQRVLSLCATVEKSVALAARAIVDRNAEYARQVIEADPEIDRQEVALEEDALKILALHQPVAIDLRFIVASIKLNTDLERIGDLAVNIAERAQYLSAQPFPIESLGFTPMSQRVMWMLRRSIDAFVTLDPALAREVCAADDEVDAMNRAAYEAVKRSIERRESEANTLVHLLSVSRHLERIADHATNIAEDVIYMTSGEIVRHRIEDYTRPSA